MSLGFTSYYITTAFQSRDMEYGTYTGGSMTKMLNSYRVQK